MSNFKCLSVPSFFGFNENLIYKMDIMFYSIRCETSIRGHKPISNSEMRLQIKEAKGSFSHRLLCNWSFCNHYRLIITKNADLRSSCFGFTPRSSSYIYIYGGHLCRSSYSSINTHILYFVFVQVKMLRSQISSEYAGAH